MSSLSNFQRVSANGVGKEESKEEKKICMPRSSSPPRPTEEEDFLELKYEGATTRAAAKRKSRYDTQIPTSKEMSYNKQCLNLNDN